MSEMVARMAAAIRQRALETCEGDHSEDWLSDQFARAALEALREPTPEMVFAMGEASEATPPSLDWDHEGAVWCAGITAALGETGR